MARFNRLAPALAVAAAALAAPLCGEAAAAPFLEPPVFTSSKGVLDLLMVAKPKPVKAIAFQPPGLAAPINPTGWVYEICYRASSFGDSCVPGPGTSSEFGGVRLALQPGDTLKIRLVNKLPTQDRGKVMHYWNSAEATPTVDPNGINLWRTPTNLHTHGLVVQARAATKSNPTWGDNIYVDLYNPANGKPVPQPLMHGIVVTSGVLDYVIKMPRNEPSGADWFRPHVHGITSDSLSSGLAGIISIGDHSKYLKDGKRAFPKNQVRHLILKDMQVLAAGTINFAKGSTNSYPQPVTDGEVLDDQQDPQFCDQYPSDPLEKREGSCPGTNVSDDNDYTGGRWYFPVSGQIYPTIPVNRPKGELWSMRLPDADAADLGRRHQRLPAARHLACRHEEARRLALRRGAVPRHGACRLAAAHVHQEHHHAAGCAQRGLGDLPRRGRQHRSAAQGCGRHAALDRHHDRPVGRG